MISWVGGGAAGSGGRAGGWPRSRDWALGFTSNYADRVGARFLWMTD